MSTVATERRQRAIARQLGAWSVASIVSGGALWAAGRFQDRPLLVGLGRQSAAWGVVDLAIAVAGEVRRRRGDERPPEVVRRRLRRLLLVNAGLDVVYVGGGALLVRAGRAGRGPTVVGDGVAVVVQGAFLLAFDTWHAARLGDHR